MTLPFPESPRSLAAILAERGLFLRRDLGQRFLLKPDVLEAIAGLARLERIDFVLEVGTGIGTLTRFLCPPTHTLSVEIDRGLHALAVELLGPREGLELLHGDVLAGKRAIDSRIVAKIAEVRSLGLSFKVVSNLPYAITTPFLVALLVGETRPDLAVLTVQREACLTMAAEPGSKDFGILSVALALTTDVRVVRTLRRECFWPVPEVTSSVVVLTPKAGAGGPVREAVDWARALFRYRRKSLLAAMKHVAASAEEREQAHPIIGAAGLDPKAHVDSLPAEAFARLAAAAPAPREDRGRRKDRRPRLR